MWLKKPNYFRVEAEATPRKTSGILIGDGQTLWIYWPQGRPQWELVDDAKADPKHAIEVLHEEASPAGMSFDLA